MKQTPIDWLVEQVNADCHSSTFIRPELVEKAKAMEREQIILAHQGGNTTPRKEWRREVSIKYYNSRFHETYGVSLNDGLYRLPVETKLVNAIIFDYRNGKNKGWHSMPKIRYLFKLTPDYISELRGIGVKQVEAFNEIIARLEKLREKKASNIEKNRR